MGYSEHRGHQPHDHGTLLGGAWLVSENIHRASFCCESLGRDGLALTSHSTTRIWPLLLIQTRQWREVGGISAIIPNLRRLPVADIANQSQHSFFCRASWDPDISSQVEAADELESSVEAQRDLRICSETSPGFFTSFTLSGEC